MPAAVVVTDMATGTDMDMVTGMDTVVAADMADSGERRMEHGNQGLIARELVECFSAEPH